MFCLVFVQIDVGSKGEQEESTGMEPEVVTCLGTSVENKAISNLTAVKTVDSSFRLEELHF